MKTILASLITVSALLITSAQQSAPAAIEAVKPKPVATASETAPTWTVEISPAPGVNSYATREVQFSLAGKQNVAAAAQSNDTIVIQPRAIPTEAPQPTFKNGPHKQLPCCKQSLYCQSWPWARRAWSANLQTYPGLDLYSDLIRSNWYGSPYPGHIFYYNGYRPSFRFGSLQFRGFGNYDRMYNPRIIPFGYQYTGLRGYYAALALTEQFGY